MAGPPSRDGPILTIVPLPPTYRGGTEEYAYQVARRLNAFRPVVLLTSTVDPTPDSPPVPTGEIPIERLPARELFQRPVLASRTAARRLRSLVEQAALVHLHMPFPFVERRVTQWARSARVPVVLTYHMDADLGGAARVPGAGAITGAYRVSSAHPALRAASAIVANSNGYARASPVLSRHLDRVRVIPKGVDLSRFGPAPLGGDPGRREPAPGLLPGATSDEHRVVFVGRLVPYKGLPVLLSAIARVASTVPDVKLYVAGKGPQRAALEAKARALGVADRTRFLGFVPDDRLGELFRSADVVACPSIGLLESSATTLEEAAALGTPVLGSDLPGADESIPSDGVHGLLCPPGDVEAVARALERLLGQVRPPPPTRPPRSWDDVAADYITLFRELGVAPAPSDAAPKAHKPGAG